MCDMVLEKEGITTEYISLHDKNIVLCKGCFVCGGKTRCVFQEDAFHDCFEKVIKADGQVLGSPVSSADVSARMKAFLERAGVVAATNTGILKHKVGAAVAAVRRGGGLNTINTMNHFFLNKEIIIAGSTYWNMVYGTQPGEVLQDEEGICNRRNLGQNMAWILKKLYPDR